MALTQDRNWQDKAQDSVVETPESMLTYVQGIRRYILFHHKRHPKEMGVPEIEAFLTDLAVRQQVTAATQNQALSALLSLYKEVVTH